MRHQNTFAELYKSEVISFSFSSVGLPNNETKVSFDIAKIVVNSINRASVQFPLIPRQNHFNPGQLAKPELSLVKVFQVSPVDRTIESPCSAISFDAGDFVCPVSDLGGVSPNSHRLKVSLLIPIVMSSRSISVCLHNGWVAFLYFMPSFLPLLVSAQTAGVSPPLLCLPELSNGEVFFTAIATFSVHAETIKLYVAVSNRKDATSCKFLIYVAVTRAKHTLVEVTNMPDERKDKKQKA